MGLIDRFKIKSKKDSGQKNNGSMSITAKPLRIIDSPDCYVDSSSISDDERAYYQADSYYTFYSYAGTNLSSRVITFEERKKTSFPSSRGLYVAEIILLEYCKKGDYPKPKSGYPGLWWFQYGIRDVGHALESLEERGFIKWASKTKNLQNLKINELKQILSDSGLSVDGKKADLIAKIVAEIPEDRINIENYLPKYELTELGIKELEDNGYVPYMHNHKHKTTEDGRFGNTFNVWDINKLFSNGNARNWREVVGKIEKKRFGVDMANTEPEGKKTLAKKEDCLNIKNEIREFLKNKQTEIDRLAKTKGDGFEEESKGLDLKSIGKDKEALVQLYISIRKGFDAPALYRETSVLLHKYGMYEEELEVINIGLKKIPKNNRHRENLEKRKRRLEEIV